MTSHIVMVELTIEAPNGDHALGIAAGAAAHLRETFNDDGTLLRCRVSPIVDELTNALIALYPWAAAWADTQRTTLLPEGEHRRIARARVLLESLLGEDETLRRIGLPKR